MIRPGGMREAIRRPWLARGHGVLDHLPDSRPLSKIQALSFYTPPKGSPSARTFRRSTVSFSTSSSLTSSFFKFHDFLQISIVSGKHKKLLNPWATVIPWVASARIGEAPDTHCPLVLVIFSTKHQHRKNLKKSDILQILSI